MEIQEVKDALAVVTTQVDKALEKHAGQIAENGKASAEAKAEVVKVSQAFEAVNTKLTELQQKMADAKAPPSTPVSFGAEVVGSEAFKALMSGAAKRARIEVKNTILGEGGSPVGPIDTLVAPMRLPGIVGGAFRNLRVVDAIPVGATGSNMVEYTKELAFTNAAAETLEGEVKPESAITFELASAPVRTIAHWLKLSKQVLDDAPALQSYVDNRLRYGVDLRLEQQIVNGNGTSPNLSGLRDSGNFTALEGVMGETELDTLSRAKYAVLAADYTPTAILLNPADWGAIERRKSTSGEYIAGGGNAVAYIAGGLVPTVWGIPVIATNSVPVDQFVLFGSNAVQLFMRAGTVVEMYEQDEDNVQRNLVTIRAEVRAAFAVFRPAAVIAGGLRYGSPFV